MADKILKDVQKVTGTNASTHVLGVENRVPKQIVESAVKPVALPLNDYVKTADLDATFTPKTAADQQFAVPDASYTKAEADAKYNKKTPAPDTTVNTSPYSDVVVDANLAFTIKFVEGQKVIEVGTVAGQATITSDKAITINDPARNILSNDNLEIHTDAGGTKMTDEEKTNGIVVSKNQLKDFYILVFDTVYVYGIKFAFNGQGDAFLKRGTLYATISSINRATVGYGDLGLFEKQYNFNMACVSKSPIRLMSRSFKPFKKA